MATQSRLRSDRPIQPRNDESEEYISDGEDTNQSFISRGSQDESGSDSDLDANDAQDTASQDDASTAQSSEGDPDDLANISFGALAKAQATFAAPTARSRKRKISAIELPAAVHGESAAHSSDNSHEDNNNNNNNNNNNDGNKTKKPRQDPVTTRTSKHAPTVLSSRKPVSRKRSIISPPPSSVAAKPRDPRFDPTITSRTLNDTAVAQAHKAYSFLSDYRADEIQALKSEIKKLSSTKKEDPERLNRLKRQLTSMESRVRAAETRTRTREVLQRHKQAEKKAIGQGRKSRPYFLKQSEVRREVERARVEGMGKKQLEKTQKRRRMREKRKEARDMPWARRRTG